MIDKLTESVAYGPFLRFEDYTAPAVFGDDATWKGSVLYICHESLTPNGSPTCQIMDDDNPTILESSLIDTYKNWNFWRFDMHFTLREGERKIMYQLQASPEKHDIWSFWIPGATQTWRMSAYSCSGFSEGIKQELWMVDEDHPMVGHLMAQNEQQPLHLNFGGGDQLYNDDVFKQRRMREWLDISDRHDRNTRPFVEDLKEEAEDYYFAHYCLHFQAKSLREMCAKIPNVMLWDDHDIFDGWGSYPPDMLNSPVFFGIFLVARKFYLLFQHHTTLELVKEGGTDLFGTSTMNSPSFSFLKRLGPSMAILGVDIRSERTKDQVLSAETWALVFAKVRELPDAVRHLIVNFTVPIVYPKVPVSEGLLELVSHMTRVSALNALLVKTNILSSLMKFEFDEPELLDDLVDHWTGAHHSEERRKVVEQFQQLATDRLLRVTFLSGDVHCAAVGRFYSYPKIPNFNYDPFFMPQLITSALINPPPPPVAIKLMHTVDRAGNRINKYTREKMVRFFKDKHPREEKVLSRRNFLILDGHADGALKATFFVEDHTDHAHMMMDPEEFVLYVPELKSTVATRTQSSTSNRRAPARMSPRPLMRSPPISPQTSPRQKRDRL